MRKAIKILPIITILLLLPVYTAAQTETSETPEASATPAEAPYQWKITEKEVAAVQTELRRRGFYASKPTGVLDRSTREAIRAYQSENGMTVTGRIDQVTYQKLGLTYPATGKERDNERRSGVIPSIGYGIKDTVVATGQSIGGGASKVKSTTVSGYEKTKDAGTGAVSKTKEAAQDAGDSTKKGVDSVGRQTQRATDTIVGRSDDSIQLDVRELLDNDPKTKKWYSEVKEGLVTIKTPAQHEADIGALVSSIRKIPGVKSVFVIAE